MVVGSGYDWSAIFHGGGSLETQVLLTAIVLGIAVFLVAVLVPVFVRLVFLGIEWVFGLVGLTAVYNAVHRPEANWGPESLIVKLLRVVVVVIAGIGILAIWGEIEPVLRVVQTFSIPSSLVIQSVITVLLFVGAYTGMGILHHWVEELTARSDRITAHQEEISLRVVQIIFLTAAAIAALSLWGIDLGGLLVGAGFLGIVAGLAAQQTLGSLIAGFVLMLSRPFEIGDWVQIGEHEGIVSEVTIVNTRLENFDGELVVLPNDAVGNATIVNRTTKGRLRLRVEVGIDYSADPDRAMDVANEALSEVDNILSVPRPRVITSRLDDSAIVLELRFWIDKPSARRRAKAISAAIRAVSGAFQEAGIKIPFPQRELSGRGETGGFHVVESGAED
ncbi:MAG: mechanosensitive ion channel family protein [Halobacteriota archaeon]|uniref:mechanosensitive ion channel family protein n=1 Tax=Halodesulfurarchaeum sp. HSR-GB TaxID=3074077 RepID=UPI00285E8924|nr:mechanosensitive ion channel family protein [Halodesulfurarchaeum sp. HSR-GB]MDR5657080.1 mechanosensitive ion channel family protein [Halodesulfurarchaeum sp. HSR-GB]